MKKKRLYQKIVIFFMMAAMLFSFVPATAYAVGSDDSGVDEQDLKNQDASWLKPTSLEPVMEGMHIDKSDFGDVSALGGTVGYNFKDSVNYCTGNNANVKSGKAVKTGSATEPELKVTATITFPSLGDKGFVYQNGDKISVSFCKDVDNTKETGMGWATCSLTKDSLNHYVPSTYPDYGALGTMKTHMTSKSGDGKMHRKFTNRYFFNHPNGNGFTPYTWESYTTQVETGYKNANLFALADKTITLASGKNIPNSISYSDTLTNAEYKKVLTWCKNFDMPTTTKTVDGKTITYYQAKIAVSYDPAVVGDQYAIAGCAQHGQMMKDWYTCNCTPGVPHMMVNNCSACTAKAQGFATGNVGAVFTNPNGGYISSGNAKEYINNPKECRVIAYGDVLIPSGEEPLTVDIDLQDIAVTKGGTLASNTVDHVLKDSYAEKTVNKGTSQSATSLWGAAANYPGYTYLGQTPGDPFTANSDITVKRLYAPSAYTVTCQDRFYKENGTVLVKSSATPGGAKTYYYGDLAKGSDWGTTSPDTNYEYKNCTQLTVNAANLVVYRNFDLGKAKIIYHSNYGTDTTQSVDVYPGDAHTTKAANTFTRTSTVNGETLNWVLKGWSDASGATNTVNYACGSSQNFGLAKGGTKNLYAVWAPVLKVEFDAGVQGVTVNADAFTSISTKEYAYNTAVKAAAINLKAGYHFGDAMIDGTPMTEFLSKVTNGTSFATMTDCHVLSLLTVLGAQKPEKKVYKSGTSIEVDGCVVSVGDKLDYTVTITNVTAVPRDVVITDEIDTGLTYVSGSADNGGTISGRKLTWNISQLPASSSKTVKYSVTVNSTKVGNEVPNTARSIEKAITGLGEVTDFEEPSNTVKNYVMAPPEKHLRQTASTTEDIDETILLPGQTAVYTVEVANPASSDKSFVVKDKVPDGLIIKSVSDGGSVSGQTVTWSGLSIASKATKTLTINVEVSDDIQGQSIVNVANAACTDPMGSDIDSNEVENFIMKGPEKSVYLTLNEDGSTNTTKENIDEEVINDGILLTYKIDWQNPTTKERTIILKDTIPEGTRIATAADLDKASEGIDLGDEYNYSNGGSFLISDGGTYDEANKTITWELESSAASGGEKDNNYVEFSVVVLDVAQDAYIENYASMTVVSPTGINEKNPTMDSNLVRNPVLKTPHKIAKRGEQDVTDLVVNDNEEITYHITFKNPADTTKNFTVTDIVPEFTELIDGTISDGGTYNASENLITWKMPLEAGETKTVTFTVLVLEEGQNETVRNTARVYVDKAKAITDDDVPTKIYILEDPKKAVMNVDGEDINGVVKRAGDIITYHIIYKNPADDERVATITDKLPEGTEFVSATNQGSYDVDNAQFVETSGSSSYNYDPATNTIVWTTPTAAKCQENVSVDVRILDSARGTILRNTASVYIPDATKQTNEVITPVVDNPDKVATDSMGQDLDGNLVTIGEEFTYTITVKNPADESKEGFITDVLPKEVDFVSCSDKGYYDQNTHTVFWKKIPLKAKEKYSVNIRVVVNEDAKCTTIENNAVYRIDEATVSTDLRDGGKGGPRSYVTVKEVLNKKGEDVNTKIVAAGSTLLYKISYKNITSEERFFTIVDEIPEGEEVVEIGDNGFICKHPLEGFNGKPLTNRTVAWQFYVPAGQEGFVTVTTKVTATKECKLKNHATFRIVKDIDDMNAFVKDTNIVVNPVIPNPVKLVFNSSGREITDKMVTTGDVLTYRITYRNPADEVRLANIIDIIPDEVEFVSCDDGGVYDSGSHTIKWTDVESEPHKLSYVEFVVKVKESSGGKLVSNRGTVGIDEAIIGIRAKTPTSTPEDPEPSEKKTVDNYVAIKRSLDVNGDDISGEIVKVGDTLTYCIAYANTSSIEKQYKVKDILPDEVDYIEATGNPNVSGKTLTWNVTAKSGETGHLDIIVKINEKGYGKKVVNKATITEFDPNQPYDPYTITTTAVNNYVFDKDDFLKSVQDKAGKDMDGAVTVSGSKLFYHIKLHNPADVKKEFTVTDALPVEVIYSSCSDGGTYDINTHTVTWNLELEGDATADLEICVKIKDSMTSGEIRNMAHLVTKGTETDTNEVVTLVFASPVKKQYDGTVEIMNGEEVECNDEVKYTITFENPSDKEMEITVVDKIDANIVDRILDISDNGVLKNGKIVWNVDVAGKSMGEVSFTVAAPESDGITVTNKATVTYKDENLRGKDTYKTNEVDFITKDKGVDKEPDDPKDVEKKKKDPRKTPEIVKTGDNILGTW